MILGYIVMFLIAGFFGLSGVMLNVFKFRDPRYASLYYMVKFKTGENEKGEAHFEEITFSCKAKQDKVKEAEKIVGLYQQAMELTNCTVEFIWDISREEYISRRKKLYTQLNQSLPWTNIQ